MVIAFFVSSCQLFRSVALAILNKENTEPRQRQIVAREGWPPLMQEPERKRTTPKSIARIRKAVVSSICSFFLQSVCDSRTRCIPLLYQRLQIKRLLPVVNVGTFRLEGPKTTKKKHHEKTKILHPSPVTFTMHTQPYTSYLREILNRISCRCIVSIRMLSLSCETKFCVPSLHVKLVNKKNDRINQNAVKY